VVICKLDTPPAIARFRRHVRTHGTARHGTA
jgi:hypothetical protein